MKYIVSSFSLDGITLALVERKQGTYQYLDTCELRSPNFLVYDGEILYTFDQMEQTILKTYCIVNQKFVLLDELTTPITELCHLHYCKNQALLLGCSYAEGKLFAVTVLQGKFQNDFQIIRQGSLEELSRCHCIFMNDNEIGTVNIARDELIFYRFEGKKLIEIDTIMLPKGIGPRHAIYGFHTNIIYVITEYSNEIIVINRIEHSVIQRIPTLVKKVESYGATLFLTKDGKFLYAANRGEDSIVIFNVQEDGTLDYQSTYFCGGNHPRHMIETSDETEILICNKNSHLVSFFNKKSNQVTGEIPFLEPSAIVEIKDK